MDLLKRNKTAERSSYTKSLNKLDLLLNDANVTYDSLELAFCLFKQKDDTLEVTHQSYLNSLTNEKEFETEFESIESYREKSIEIRLRAQKMLEKLKGKTGNIVNTSTDGSRNVLNDEDSFKIRPRLPEIELRKFNGDLRDWLTFWNQFMKIHESKSLTDSEKFHYLMQSTEPNSDPREIIESFPVTNENYALAVQSLRERYGREDVLIEVYVRDLLGIVLSNANKKQKCSLSSLYNKLSTQLRALNSLGVTSDKCAVILFPLVESCLPLDTLRAWERERSKSTDAKTVIKNGASNLDALLLFLRMEVESEQRIKLSRSEFVSYKPCAEDRPPVTKSLKEQRSSSASAAELLNHKSHENLICVFCKQNHENRFCKRVYSLPLDEKMAIVKRNGLCLVCLNKGHMAKFCKIKLKCHNCLKRHFKFMCPNLEKGIPTEVKDKNLNDNVDKSVNTVKTVDSLHSQTTPNVDVFLQTLVVKIIGKRREKNARIVLDTGCHKSYILRSTANELGYESQGEHIFCHSLFGGTKTKERKHECYKIQLGNLNGGYICELDALDQELICNDIPSIKHGPWLSELKRKKIEISDVNEENSQPIEVLLGADVVGKLFTGKKILLKTGLVTMETKLGWTLFGKVPYGNCKRNVSMSTVSMFTQESSISNLWDLELIGIRDPVEQKRKEEIKQAVILHFEETVRMREDGRYEVSLPWKYDHAPLLSNYDVALKRLASTCKKLDKDGYRKEYQQVFDEWQREKIIEEVPLDDSTVSGHYLPHRPVVKESSTTKIRPVFDASAKIQNHPSLNDCLETGVNLIETIPSILARFRRYSIGVISDIRKAFLQISVQPRDRDFLKFLWFGEKGNLKVLRHTRVVFGVTSSPFLLGAVIEHHLLRESSKLPDNSFLKVVVEKLKHSFYVDNCVASINKELNLEPFIKEATEVMKRAGFDLRDWESNASKTSLAQNIGKSKVLGLIWDKEADCLEINSEGLHFCENETVTKRKILSLVNKIFDPVGVISPALLLPKLLLQSSWRNKEPWDAEVKDDIKKEFLKWTKELQYLKDIKIPRWIGASNESSMSLHVFCDASQIAYAAVIFVRCESADGVKVQLLQAKSRISPLKSITIPRMELLAATIGARLYNTMKDSLKLDNVQAFFWTDSSTVLSWIQRKEQWSVFVSNRVTEIRNLTSSENWLHVPGDQNPADLPSRGCGAKKLFVSKWWEGPSWLKAHQEHWPKSLISVNEKDVEAEKRRTVVSAKNIGVESIVNKLTRRISQYSKIVRVIAWMLRFQPKSKELRKNLNISPEEYSKAQKVLLRYVQTECLSDDNGRKSLSNLDICKDGEGILRMKSRLTNEDETAEFLSPIILPSKHLLVQRLIEEQHIVHKHAGSLTLLILLRQEFWILKGRKTIRSVIQNCIHCRRYHSKALKVPPPPLPKDRTKLSHTFQTTGVDLAGPLISKTKEKYWIVVFTCAVYRAVHLELVPSLSTAAFIQAVRRFIARRGRVNVFYSDNGSNFVGFNTALKNLQWDKIQRDFQVNQIRWKFNPPTASWWGGFWERLIRILKDLLRKNLGRASLNFEELATLVYECESIMNNRPLSYVSEESELRTLTPSMFLQSLPGNEVPELDAIERSSLIKRWNYVQKLRENLKQRFKKEYLGFLRSSASSRSDSLAVGDVVLIGSDDKKRLDWPLAEVQELFPGRDGIPRLIKLKTSKGYCLRPIQRLYRLELPRHEKENCESCNTIPIAGSNEHSPGDTLSVSRNVHSSDDDVRRTPESRNPITTRLGRTVKVPERLNI